MEMVGKLSIRHWNLGRKHWTRKVDTIQALVDERKSNLAFISES